MDYRINNDHSYYYIPTKLDPNVVKCIRDQYLGATLERSRIGPAPEERKYDPCVRKSEQLWIPTDNWVSGIMAHLIHCANFAQFDFNLTQWAGEIQYTRYTGKGSHYSWHTDSAKSVYDSSVIRKLSISLMLSEAKDYEGGEFQMLIGQNTKPVTLKLDVGDAVIFPSSIPHRVKKLKSGLRESLVGWYGGPHWR